MSLTGSNNAERIWNYLRGHGLTEAGAAGLMGNLQCESGLKPTNVEDLLEPKIGYNDATYTAAIDSGKITRAQFLHPLPGKQYGYGLAQWTSPGRKAGLYDLCKKRKVSIGDLETQLEWLITELKTSYKEVHTAIVSTEDVMTASNIVLLRFEIPANTNAAVKQARYLNSLVYYGRYHGTPAAAPASDQKPAAAETGITVDDVLGIARSWIGYSEASGKHRQIVDLYNSHKPLARGYVVQYTDSWCDTFVSAVFIKAGNVAMIGGTECGCEEHVALFKKAGIWIEDGTITPEPGDIILFAWSVNAQPNNAYSDHIGFVEAVSGGMITTIEGNKNDTVGRRVLPVGAGNIRGYARPKYATKAAQPTDTIEPDKYFVRMGSFAGTQVNSFRIWENAKNECDAHPGSMVFDAAGKQLYPEKKAEKKPATEAAGKDGKAGAETGGTLKKTVAYTGIVTARELSVRIWAGTEYPEIKSVPVLPKGAEVGVCDTITDIKAEPWHYVKVKDGIYGFVCAQYVKRKK